MQHADANSYPVWFLRICIGVLCFEVGTADGQWPPLRGCIAGGCGAGRNDGPGQNLPCQGEGDRPQGRWGGKVGRPRSIVKASRPAANPSAPACALGHLPLAGEVKRKNLRPVQRPEVPGMALRDGSMWSSTPTGCYGALRGACFAVGASIARPRYNPPPNAARRCKFVPGWVCEFASACCIFFVFTADGQWPPLHTDTHPSGGRCSYGCTDVQNFLETPIRFFAGRYVPQAFRARTRMPRLRR